MIDFIYHFPLSTYPTQGTKILNLTNLLPMPIFLHLLPMPIFLPNKDIKQTFGIAKPFLESIPI